jgi:hypothetical protein
MTVFCTYCSCEKSREPGRIPAIERYKSERIQKVYRAACGLEVPFFILSGCFGLLSPNARIPYYDHLLQDHEVPEMAEKIAKQIRTRRIEGFVFFTKAFMLDRNARRYHDTLAAACAKLSVPMCSVDLPPG